MGAFALVHYPNIDCPSLSSFRQRYDPQATLIAPHITLLFPVPTALGEEPLVHHLASILRPWRPFPFRLHEVQLSTDRHLFLLLQEGNDELIRLHQAIYSGMLASYRRAEFPFVPHLTLGVVDQDVQEPERALQEASALTIDHRGLLDRLHLVQINNERTHVIRRQEFRFAA